MKTLICENGQYGYSDFYYYVKYLSRIHQVDYFCLDAGRERIPFDGDQIFIYKRHRSAVGCLKQIIHTLRFIKQRNPDIVIVRYFRYCLFVGLLCKRPAILDIRTVDVSRQRLRRFANNVLLRFTASLYSNKLTIKQDIAVALKLRGNVAIVPLGAEKRQIRTDSNIDSLRLLYVGTLNNRRLHETVEGLSIFCAKHNDMIVRYTIVGDGKPEDIDQLNYQISRIPTNLLITFAGYIPTTELDPLYESHNIGVSYVPIIKAYMPQPVTKTYEYLMAGMVVIGTAVPFHYETLHQSNGVIINDTPESFAEGIERLYQNRAYYKLLEIQKASIIYSWQNVIESKLVPTLEKLIHP